MQTAALFSQPPDRAPTWGPLSSAGSSAGPRWPVAGLLLAWDCISCATGVLFSYAAWISLFLSTDENKPNCTNHRRWLSPLGAMKTCLNGRSCCKHRSCKKQSTEENNVCENPLSLLIQAWQESGSTEQFIHTLQWFADLIKHRAFFNEEKMLPNPRP